VATRASRVRLRPLTGHEGIKRSLVVAEMLITCGPSKADRYRYFVITRAINQ
jgi:hypothetical protein